jgi:hypothetical protein
MLERAIENWLINVNERDYQVPYCQVLLHNGHKIIYISSHRSMEQGKDIVSIGPNGECYAYQLKTGNIDLTKWRGIYGQIIELMELTFSHPDIDKSKTHKSFLVLNGRVTDEVRIQIDQINQDNIAKNRNVSYLKVVEIDALLKDFIDAQGEFFPKQLGDLQLFLELYLTKGNDFIPKEKLFKLYNEIFFRERGKSCTVSLNAISSSIILTGYLLLPFQKNNNYYAIFEAWSLLLISATNYAITCELKKEEWQDSYNLISKEIIDSLLMLNEETQSKDNFLEGIWFGDGGVVYRARATLVLGALSALSIYLHKYDKSYKTDNKLLELVEDNLTTLWLWGESAFPFFFFIIKYLELNDKWDKALSLLKVLLEAIIQENSPRKQTGLASLYYNQNDIIESILAIRKEEIDFKEFSGGSYILEILINMLVRRNGRDILEENWKEISRIHFLEFIPQKTEDIFSWHLKKGQNSTRLPNATQSWDELIGQNDRFFAETLLLEDLTVLLFLILVCPHRISNNIITILDRNFVDVNGI